MSSHRSLTIATREERRSALLSRNRKGAVRRVLLLALICATAALGQVTAPLIGFVCDRRGDLRPVHGVAGNFLLGAPVLRGVLSAAFGGDKGVAKTSDEFIFFDAAGAITSRRAAAPGPAIFRFLPDGRPAAAHLDSGDVVRFADGDAPRLEVFIDGAVYEARALGRKWAVASVDGLDRAVDLRTGSDYRLPEVDE